MPRGIIPRNVGGITTSLGAVPFLFQKQTVAGTSTYQIFPGGAPFSCQVVGFFGTMSGAGGAGDTIQLQDKSGNAITDAIDVSALTTKDVFDCATLDSTYWTITKGDNLKIVTASDALAYMLVKLVKV